MTSSQPLPQQAIPGDASGEIEDARTPQNEHPVQDYELEPPHSYRQASQSESLLDEEDNLVPSVFPHPNPTTLPHIHQTPQAMQYPQEVQDAGNTDDQEKMFSNEFRYCYRCYQGLN